MFRITLYYDTKYKTNEQLVTNPNNVYYKQTSFDMFLDVFLFVVW